jgi:pantoate--beta-alanine ligase
MIVIKDIESLRAVLKSHRISQNSISLVPTMGALHEGHLSLVEVAKKNSNVVCMSIFVNPLQFNSAEDFKNYPITLEEDLKQAEKAGVDLVFVPSTEELYPKGQQPVRLIAGSCAGGLCGSTRPGHFDGVVTVVSILFNLFNPDVAVFGEKDFQQLKVIEQLVRDLHFDVKILAAPLVRQEDGLALSSRNLRLSAAERVQALSISKALFWAKEAVNQGATEVKMIKERVYSELTANGIKVDYVEIVDCQRISPVNKIEKQAQLAVAGFVGDVRLIDNISLIR